MFVCVGSVVGLLRRLSAWLLWWFCRRLAWRLKRWLSRRLHWWLLWRVVHRVQKKVLHIGLSCWLSRWLCRRLSWRLWWRLSCWVKFNDWQNVVYGSYQSILATGEVAKLIPKDELIVMAVELRSMAMKKIANFAQMNRYLFRVFFSFYPTTAQCTPRKARRLWSKRVEWKFGWKN